jgi:16S rRNA (guanine527-N7)-methyltransferase
VRDPRLERWLEALVATPGLTAVHDLEAAWSLHVEDSLAALPAVSRFDGPVVDVGSGGGAPGIPLAASLPTRSVTLLEATERKCAFLRDAARSFPNVSVVCGRAEEQPTDGFGVAVAKALASPPAAAEWCLPLVRPGGGVVLWVGPSADADHVARVAQQVGGALVEAAAGLIVLRKVDPTPPGFPRRPGMARKRPLR